MPACSPSAIALLLQMPRWSFFLGETKAPVLGESEDKRGSVPGFRDKCPRRGPGTAPSSAAKASKRQDFYSLVKPQSCSTGPRWRFSAVAGAAEDAGSQVGPSRSAAAGKAPARPPAAVRQVCRLQLGPATLGLLDLRLYFKANFWRTGGCYEPSQRLSRGRTFRSSAASLVPVNLETPRLFRAQTVASESPDSKTLL